MIVDYTLHIAGLVRCLNLYLPQSVCTYKDVRNTNQVSELYYLMIKVILTGSLNISAAQPANDLSQFLYPKEIPSYRAWILDKRYLKREQDKAYIGNVPSLYLR